MPKIDWAGVFPAITTQFHKDLSLDLDATQRHLEVLIDSKISGVVVLGSLGENVTLSRPEKEAVVKSALEVAKGKIPVISGVAELSTESAGDFVKALEVWGADGAMVMPCMAFRPDAEEVLAHYRTVSRATNLPIIVYNNPLSYHADVTPELFSRLADEENLVAIKESSGDIRRITDLINVVGDRYVLFAGVDDLALEAVFLGATGWIAGIGLAFPKENQALWELATRGEWEKARELYRWYTPLLHLDVGLKFVQNIKLAIQEVGLGTEHVRLPRLPLSGVERERVLGIIHEGLAHRPSVE
jgi:4-hydroxy-tetrahydrodipicolinate synthase